MHLIGFNVIGLRSYDFAGRVPHQTIMSHFFLNLLKKPGLLQGRITVAQFPEVSEPKCLRRLKAMSHWSCGKRSVQSCAQGKHRREIYQTAPTPIWHASAVVENLPSCSPNQAEVPILPLRSLRHIMTLAFNAITCFGLLSKPHWNNAIRALVGVAQWSSRIFQPWPFYSYTDLCVSPVSLQIL